MEAVPNIDPGPPSPVEQRSRAGDRVVALKGLLRVATLPSTRLMLTKRPQVQSPRCPSERKESCQ
jgi:hypothetical protein